MVGGRGNKVQNMGTGRDKHASLVQNTVQSTPTGLNYGTYGETGHLSLDCPNSTTQDNLQLLNIQDNVNGLSHYGDFQFTNLREDKCKTSSISPYWILLDSESTTSVMKNRDLLSNIWELSHPITCHSNGGTQVSSLVGRLKGFGDVWFNTESLANMLSLAEMVTNIESRSIVNMVTSSSFTNLTALYGRIQTKHTWFILSRHSLETTQYKIIHFGFYSRCK